MRTPCCLSLVLPALSKQAYLEVSDVHQDVAPLGYEHARHVGGRGLPQAVVAQKGAANTNTREGGMSDEAGENTVPFRGSGRRGTAVRGSARVSRRKRAQKRGTHTLASGPVCLVTRLEESLSRAVGETTLDD